MREYNPIRTDIKCPECEADPTLFRAYLVDGGVEFACETCDQYFKIEVVMQHSAKQGCTGCDGCKGE